MLAIVKAKRKGGNRLQSMDEIYQAYAQTVYRYLFSLTQDPDLAEELTQETFYQAIRCIHRFDGSCKISTWLCAIAKNQLSVYYRKHPITEALPSTGIPAPHGSPTQHTASCHRNWQNLAASAESTVLSEISRIELLKKLHNCPEPFREILYLRIFGNLSFKEIGTIIGKTENWTRVTYYRGKEKLRKELERDET